MTAPMYMGRGTQRFDEKCQHGKFDGACEDRDCAHFSCEHGNGIDCDACKLAKRESHRNRLRGERIVARWLPPLVLLALVVACSGEAFVSEGDTSAEVYPDADATGMGSDAWQAPETSAKPEADAGVPDSNGTSAEASDDVASAGNCCDGTCTTEPLQACTCNSGKQCCYQWECPTP